MRREWKFSYPISEVREGANKKSLYYNGRLEFWKNQKIEVERAIKESGLVIDESLTDTISNMNYGRGSSVQIDPKLSKDFKECFDKIREHESNVLDYLAWIQLLDSRPQNETLSLDKDDWIFFFGA